MTEDRSVESMLEIARQTVDAAGCASFVTLDAEGDPSSRAVAAFPPDEGFRRIVVGSHPASRKSQHVASDGRVLLSYIDNTNRGYLTVIGRARIGGDSDERQTYWVDRFAAFFPDGPKSDEYQLILVTPDRLELRSFGLGAAENPTRWSPVGLVPNGDGGWRMI